MLNAPSTERNRRVLGGGARRPAESLMSAHASRPTTSRPKLSGLVPSFAADSSAMRWTMTVSGKIESGSLRPDARRITTFTPERSATVATSESRSDQGPPPSRQINVSPSRRATDGPWRNCSMPSPSEAT